jgi:hypothetical protein
VLQAPFGHYLPLVVRTRTLKPSKPFVVLEVQFVAGILSPRIGGWSYALPFPLSLLSFPNPCYCFLQFADTERDNELLFCLESPVNSLSIPLRPEDVSGRPATSSD